MTLILLVRHATTAATGERLGGWTPGVHLDDKGRAQATTTAEMVAEHAVAAVYSSPLERTMDTAAVIADRVDVDVQVRAGLGETDYGDWTNRPLGELRDEPLWRRIQATPSRVTFPGGESLRATHARIVDQVEELAGQHPDDLVVAVSHADPIKAVVAHFAGMPLDLFQRLVISPASVTVLALDDAAGPMLWGVNLQGRLPVPPPRDVDATPDGDAASANDDAEATEREP